MKQKISFFIVLLFMCIEPVQAQLVNPQGIYATLHRPAGLNWQVLKTDHFRVIFPQGLDSLAYRTGLILEQQYPLTQKLTGGSLKNFPVIITDYNDLSNGFVTPVNFRSEFDAASSKSKSLSPKSGDWFETVIPHELLHAVHGNVSVPFSIPSVIGILSPDIARTVNFYPPVGVHEGLAVYHESNHVWEGGGRDNHAYYYNQFSANVSSNTPWSSGQIFSTSRYHLPFNRHYISGSTFTEWLHENYGEETSKQAIRFHNKFFVFGYGYALYFATGKWPGELYREYLSNKKTDEAERKQKIGESTSTKQALIGSPYRGVRQNKPIWISNSEIVFHATHYNAPRGFYKFDVNTKKTTKVKEIFTVNDFNIDFSIARKELLFSEYDADLIYPSTFKTELKSLNLETGGTNEITKADRVYSPTYSGNDIIALQTNKASADVVLIDKEGSKKMLASFNNATPVAIKANPQVPNQLALIVNRRGVQALWITSPQTIARDILEAPEVAFKNGSIYDIDWHPSENKLLFTAEVYPAMNVYELDLSNGDIFQKTNSLYNAFEGSYSPDASSIAYVIQQNQEQKIAILRAEDFYNKRISRDVLLSGNDLQEQFNRPLLGSSISDSAGKWNVEKYSTDLKWLKPRTMLPVFRENSGTTQAGVSLQSVDPLGSQSYSLEITGIQDRLWYDLIYSNKTFWPGFRFRAYSDPSFRLLRFSNGTDTQDLPVMLQERGFSLSMPLSFNINSSTRGKALFISPRITAEQFRYFNLTPTTISDFETQYKAAIFSQLSWNILTQRRDIQPSSGISVFGFVDKALNDPTATLNLGGGNRGSVTFRDRWAAYYGAIGYIAPLRKLNQSLRLDAQFLNQSQRLLYSTSTIVPSSFTDDAFVRTQQSDPFYNNLARLSARYVIPIAYPGSGGLLVPAYLRAVYISIFSHTITDLDQSDLLTASRSVFGGGLHFQFNISNLTFDLGLGISFEPTRNQAKFVFGDF